ncbi:MAG: hypothetical protein KH366_07825 [Clostridiaceae bacterium]|nr:hypothetical protein [Clostridiaceae bacterium]
MYLFRYNAFAVNIEGIPWPAASRGGGTGMVRQERRGRAMEVWQRYWQELERKAEKD